MTSGIIPIAARMKSHTIDSMSETDPIKGDYLSNKARTILRINARDAYTDLVPRAAGATEAADVLHAVSPADLLDVPVKSSDDAACVLSALWLWHDYLDESHTISQRVEDPTGSFWHAIMHRREGDFGNSKYWYAKCRSHPMLESIAAQANPIIARADADKGLLRLTMSGWNGPAFVDYVQSVHESPSDPRYPIAVALQQVEWRALFDHCVRQATGK
jgi:hypothetical protein